MHQVERATRREQSHGRIKQVLHQSGVNGCAVVEWRVERDGVKRRVREARASVIPGGIQADGTGGKNGIGVRIRCLRVEATGNRTIAASEIE